MSNSSVFIGALAESEACDFLEKHGLTLIEKNFFVLNAQGKKIGEIDIIMRDKEFLVFIEVKKRGRKDYGDALEMISKQKQSRLIRTAIHYLLRNYSYDKEYCRFDVIGISKDKIEWIKNAFEVQY